MIQFKTKITGADITYGPVDPDDFVAEIVAFDLAKKGYRGISNAFCRVSRIDREDWLDVLARERHCSRADFYNLDGSGIGDQHRDYYIRAFSKDTLTVHPQIYQQLRKYKGQYA